MSQEILEDPPIQSTATSETDVSLAEVSSIQHRFLGWFSGKGGILMGVGMGMILTLAGSRLLSGLQPTTSQTKASASYSQVTAQTVTVTEVKRSLVNRTLALTGTVTASELIPVLSQATGRQIREILVEEGQTVAAGQLLARLDNGVLQAQLAQAKAAQAQAQARLDELLAGSRPEEIAQARAAVASAAADIAMAKSEQVLAQKRLERNQALAEQGGITLDALDEVSKEALSKASGLEQTQARLGEAKQQLALLEAGPRAETIAQARAQLAEAKGQVQLVSAQLNDTRVVAPVAGKIARRNARVGDTTSTSSETPLFSIIEEGRLELQAQVPETQLGQIRLGQSVTVTSDLNRTLTLSGQVRAIEPIIDEQSRQAIVKIALPTGKGLKPGMFLQAALVVSQTPGVTTEMAAILPQANGEAIAFVLQPDNTVKASKVQLGAILSGEKIEVLAGVMEGDRLIVKGAAYLQDGDRVEVIEPKVNAAITQPSS